MPNRRMVLVGMAAALGLRGDAEAGKQARKRRKRAAKRVNWCYAHPERAVGCDRLPSQTCRAYVALAENTCCEKARQGWGAFNRCLNA